MVCKAITYKSAVTLTNVTHMLLVGGGFEFMYENLLQKGVMQRALQLIKKSSHNDTVRMCWWLAGNMVRDPGMSTWSNGVDLFEDVLQGAKQVLCASAVGVCEFSLYFSTFIFN
jgi:hypothetical protein